MNDGQQLQMFRQPVADPEVDGLVELLFSARRWVTAKELEIMTDGLKDRSLRDLASQTVEIISGNEGYLHIDHATKAEIETFVARISSQGKKMLDRAKAVQARAKKTKRQ